MHDFCYRAFNLVQLQIQWQEGGKANDYITAGFPAEKKFTFVIIGIHSIQGRENVGVLISSNKMNFDIHSDITDTKDQQREGNKPRVAHYDLGRQINSTADVYSVCFPRGYRNNSQSKEILPTRAVEYYSRSERN